MLGATIGQLARTTLISIFLVAQVQPGKAQIAAAQSQIAGTWRGKSDCVVKNSPCHDEINVYRFTEVAARPGWFSGAGSRVVNGNEILMGTLEWHYDPKNHILESNNQNGVFRFDVGDGKMEGTLLLPNGTAYRRIHLTKAK